MVQDLREIIKTEKLELKSNEVLEGWEVQWELRFTIITLIGENQPKN